MAISNNSFLNLCAFTSAKHSSARRREVVGTGEVYNTAFSKCGIIRASYAVLAIILDCVEMFAE
ncbi:MAG: hypothetical protein MUO61_03865 [Dehalococcoidia bacterium]|nr:hypothetical protein [Dehalococcoidia bacterium]